MDEDRTGSVGVRQAAMTKAVAMSTLNINAAKRAETNQPKVMTIAGMELASVLFRLHICEMFSSLNRELCTSEYQGDFAS